MKNRILGIVVLTVAIFSLGSLAEEPVLEGGLEKLRPFLGVWRGEFKRSEPANPMIDVAVWERALNGKAIRVTHSINDGLYGGESLMLWDAKNERIEYFYFTTAAFRTTGTIKISGNVLTGHEKIIGDSAGTTEVRSRVELREDGTMRTESEYLKNGAWEPGHAITYRRAPEAQAKFK